MNPRNLCVLPFALSLTLPLAAQNMLGYHPGGAAGTHMTEYPMRSPAFGPGGGPGVPVGVLPAPARPAQPRPLGSIAVDDTTGVVYTTNGLGSIQRSWYPRLGVVPPIVALPNLPIPAAVGQVHGMAVDPVTKHLFLCNGVMMFEVNPLAGMAIVSSWPQAPMNTLTDLEFDPAQPGNVYAVSTVGEIATYVRGGGFVGFVAPTYPIPAGGMAVGLALDRSDAPVVPACPHWYVLWDNGQVWDQQFAALHTVVYGGHAGLTYLASPVNLPGAGACGGATPIVRVSTLAFDNNPGFGIEAGGFAAGTPLAALVLNLPGFGPPIPAGAAGTFWLPGGWTHAVAVLGPGATRVRFALPLPAGLIGLRFFAQCAIACPAAAAGHVLTDALQIEVSS